MSNEKLKLIVELDQAELTIRLFEAFLQKKRPKDVSAIEFLSSLRQENPEICERFLAASMTAMIYFRDQADLIQVVQ